MSLLDILCLLALIYCAVLALILRRHAKKAEWLAAQNEKKYLQLFEDVPLACQETDLHGIIQRVNRKLCDLRGLQPFHILGKHYADFAPESERERVREITRRKLAGDLPPASQKQTYLRKDGESATVQVYETLLRDEKGDIVGLRSAALDVTEHLRKEEEIWQTTAELTLERCLLRGSRQEAKRCPSGGGKPPLGGCAPSAAGGLRAGENRIAP